MKRNRVDIFWGLVLIVIGSLLLGQKQGIIPDPSLPWFAAILGSLSLALFATYLIKGTDQWGWLFPSLITGALAVIIILAESGQEGSFMGTLILWSIAVPFIAAFLVDHHRNWWALIPGWIMTLIGAIVLFESVLSGEIIGAMILFGIASPFFVIYLMRRQHWWALIPAYILTILSLVVLLESNRPSDITGGFFLLALAIPFFIVYIRNRAHWWAQIPAGVLSTLGLVALLSGSTANLWEGRLLGAFFFLGLAVTFGLLWRQRDRHPTHWAKYPAAALAFGVLLVIIWGDFMEIISAVLLIGVGAWILLENRRQLKLKG